MHFRVWAPAANHVQVELSEREDFQGYKSADLLPEEKGYFSGFVEWARTGMLYKFKLPTGSFSDPASRFQPCGPHGPSQVVDPASFQWTDLHWKGVSRYRQIIYELHVGTFTPEGTWKSAAEKLPLLADLGITMLEVLPVADFPGNFGWGYDGVNQYAPTRLYGAPDDFRAFVDRAHSLGLAVILDVVYNHMGPDGNYLGQYSKDYETDRHQNEWGRALNFDGENCASPREFFSTNAAYWIGEFHLDGLRLDATQQIFDTSEVHILSEINQKAREAAAGRSIYIVAENEAQTVRPALPTDHGGYGLDAQWNDDWHHSALAAATGRKEAYYSDFKGSPQEFISAAKHGYLFQGQWFTWQKMARGEPAFRLSPEQFVTYTQNHDQIANSLRGWRLHQLTSPGTLRALTALLLLGPATPMLFQGQEFNASAPFLFFADHNPDLGKLVRKGRREFLRQFNSIACRTSDPYLNDPGDFSTFQRCKLDWAERERNKRVLGFYRDLIHLRITDSVFSQPRPGYVDGAVLSSQAFCLRFFGEAGDDRLVLVNFGVDLPLSPIPEPLMAPGNRGPWRLMWSSEDPKYAGCGTPEMKTDASWALPGHAALVLAPEIEP